MRYAVLSDIHSNLESFQAVLDEIEKDNIGKIFLLGDIVGYGSNPNECVELVKKIADISIAGNHDYAVVDLTDISQFSKFAKLGVEWTKTTLKEEYKNYLKELPLQYQIEGIKFVHSTPKNPELWNYIISPYEAEKNFDYFEEQICFVGHSHRPVIFVQNKNRDISVNYEGYINLDSGSKYIINAGSVGQPRDGNPAASYIVYDVSKQTIEIKRVKYDIHRTQEKIMKAGLPKYLADRLERGR